KATIQRYLEYLEAAFLIKRVNRLGEDGKYFKRQNFFKVYLTNPSIRSALFAPVSDDDGAMAETAVFSQWFHLPTRLHYARWNKARMQGEVDLILLDSVNKPKYAVEIKWSDRFIKSRVEPKSLIYFCKKNGLSKSLLTTKTKFGSFTKNGMQIDFLPLALYCYWVGEDILRGKEFSQRFLKKTNDLRYGKVQ
ncbi:MAG: DUF4143 domain-containing protein, partial [Deltaproteobacteria bacterium]|nr:DUF4143 domain-containing protein [Deltaproteobacteria bacterium]